MISGHGNQGEQTGAAGTEGGRRPTGVPAAPVPEISPQDNLPVPNPQIAQPNPQVLERPAQRKFSKAYRKDILRQISECTKEGQIGALLRREGLYWSLVCNWRKQEEQGRLDENPTDPCEGNTGTSKARLSKLERENAQLKRQLQQAELILEIQKKASEILGISLKPLDNERSD